MFSTNQSEPSNNLLSNKDSRFVVSIAQSAHEILECQRLRFRVFAEEMGACLASADQGIDKDYFDNFCKQLMVKDTHTNQVVACTRVMNTQDARDADGFYSETEFNLRNILLLNAKFLEVGRTCVAVEYRSTPAINYLWQGVARLMILNRTDYLFGCVSIPMTDGGRYLETIMRGIRVNHFAREQLQVIPKIPVKLSMVPNTLQAVYPSLLKRYLNIGGVICGEPCFDADFNVADIFVLVDRDRISKRYQRHFLESA